MIAIFDAVARLSTAFGGGPAAELAASALVEADALGLPRFGIALLDEWTPDTAPAPAIVGSGAIRRLDGSSCFAPLAVAAATLDVAHAASARQFGLAAVFLRGVRGFGRLAPFVRHLADAGLVGIAGAEGPPFVAPHGGKHPVIGTNPLAIAMGQGAERVIIDVASGSATMADVRTARAAGTPLPDGIALDHEGKPTRIAADVAALLPRGGLIGSLLGLVVELTAGVAAGGRGDPHGRGVFILAFDPEAAAEGVDWHASLAGLKNEWTAAGGHWPHGGGLPRDGAMPDDFAQRLDIHLNRIAAWRAQ